MQLCLVGRSGQAAVDRIRAAGMWVPHERYASRGRRERLSAVRVARQASAVVRHQDRVDVRESLVELGQGVLPRTALSALVEPYEVLAARPHTSLDRCGAVMREGHDLDRSRQELTDSTTGIVIGDRSQQDDLVALAGYQCCSERRTAGTF